MSFLHAYSRLGCRAVTGSRPPIAALAFKISAPAQGRPSPIPDLTAPPCRSVSEKGQSGDVSSSATVAGIKLIYYTSIRQRERSCFRHLNFWCLWLKSVGIIALHAYTPPLHAVKASQPLGCDVKSSKDSVLQPTVKEICGKTLVEQALFNKNKVLVK